MRERRGLLSELHALADQFNFNPSTMRDIHSPRWNSRPLFNARAANDYPELAQPAELRPSETAPNRNTP